MKKFKQSINNAFNNAAKSYDELMAAGNDCVPVPAIGVLMVELYKELVKNLQPKP